MLGCLAQLARASALHAEGQGFESLNTHHEILLAHATKRGLKKFQCRGGVRKAHEDGLDSR